MMRAAFFALALAACGHPEVHFDVVVTQEFVSVSVFAADRLDVVSNPYFVHLGECGGWSDDSDDCQANCPGDWIGAVRVEERGATLGETTFRAATGAALVGGLDTTTFDQAVVVVADQDGTTVRIPIPEVARPQPIIDAVAETGDPPYHAQTTVTWHSVPRAASAMVSLTDPGGGSFCHVTDTLTNTATPIGGDWGATPAAGVTAFAPAVETTTAFGDAEVWVGTSTSTTVPPAPFR